MSQRYRIPAAIVVGLLLLYTLAGFLILPAVARSQAVEILREDYGLDLTIEQLRFNPYSLVAEVEGLALKDADGALLVSFRHLVVNLQWRSLFERAIVLREIAIAHPFAHVHLRPDGTLNLATAFTPTQPPDPGGSPSAEAGDEPALPAILIGSLRMSDGELRVTDERDGRRFDQRLTPLDLELEHFSTRPEEDGDLIRFVIHLAAGGQIAMTGDLSANPARFELKLEARDLPLPIAQPYMPETLAAEIADGRLSFDLDVHYGQPGQSTLMSIGGSAAITDLAVMVAGRDEPVLAWDEVALAGIALDLEPDRLFVEEIAVRGLDSAFRIYPDGDTNIARVLRSATESEAPPEGAAAPDGTAVAETGGAAEFPFTIERIVVDGSTLLYNDQMIRPAVAIRMDGLGGEFTGLDADPASRLTTRLEGRVGSHGRAEVGGVAALFAEAPDLDMKVAFSNIEMTDFSPYAGKFVGYEILQGKLFLDLRYTLAGTRLRGDNHAVFDQFELGDRVDSEDALRLPVKLALSLLRDRHGRIDLRLPVEGDIDDPTFRFGHLVWQVLVNTLTKIAMAPFSFIASVFGGGPEMEYAQFAAGSAELADEERAKFAPLAAALAERPRLIVEIQGRADHEADDAVLRERRLEAVLAAAPSLAAAFDARFGDGAAAALREELAAAQAESQAQGQGEAGDAVAEAEAALRARLLAAQPVDDEELVALAFARGQQVMDELVRSGGVEAERVFVRRGEIAGAGGEGLRAQLKLDTR